MKRVIIISLLFLNGILSVAQSNPYTIDFSENQTIIPISYRSGANPIIEVKINGKGPYKFMFDTGSPTFAKLDEKVFKDLNLPITDSILAGDGSGINRKSFPVTQLKQIAVGSYHINNVDAMVRDYNQRKNIDAIDGVIGLSFFKNVLVELNFEKNQLIISKGKLDKKDKNVFSIAMQNDIPAIGLQLGTKNISAVFDTGNMGWLSLHNSDISSDMIIGTPKVIGRAKTVSNEFEIREAQLKQSIFIETIEFRNPTVIINDVLPQANAGIRFLKQMNITFDQQNNLVRLIKISPQPSAVHAEKANEYTGKYGERTISLNNDGTLFIQRPGGMPMKMTAKTKDEFGLEMVQNALIVFERDSNNQIIAVKVSKGDGNWERSERLN